MQVDLAVVFLAALTSGIPTMTVHVYVGKKISKGVVLNGFTKSIVGKSKGVQLIVADFIAVAVVTTILALIFESIYAQNIDKIAFSYVGVIFLIIVSARVHVGGKYSVKGILACATFGVLGSLSFLYGIGAHIPLLF